MKKIIFALATFTALFSACKETPKDSKPAETVVVVPEMKKDTTPVLPPNKVDKMMLHGSWRSTIDKKSTIVFAATTAYVMSYNGKKVEEGTYDVPADCKGCVPAAPDGCFFFKSEDGNDCCSIVKLTKDELQYFVLGTAGQTQSFKRVN